MEKFCDTEENSEVKKHYARMGTLTSITFLNCFWWYYGFYYVLIFMLEYYLTSMQNKTIAGFKTLTKLFIYEHNKILRYTAAD